jgi:OOP family OmpA-OmpF porin
MKAVPAVLGLTAAVLAFPAAAQMTSDAGPYVGATIGQSKLKCDGGCDQTDTAWRILGGYQLNRNFAAELGYSNFGEFSSTKANAWELVGLGIFPVTSQFGIYGKLGGHHSEVKGGSTETGNGLTYGAGLQFDIMPQLGLRGEWQRYDKVAGISDLKTDVLSIGAVWRFR